VKLKGQSMTLNGVEMKSAKRRMWERICYAFLFAVPIVLAAIAVGRGYIVGNGLSLVHCSGWFLID